MATRILKMVVAGDNSEGAPDFYFCNIQATEAEVESGLHYEAAKDAASEHDYSPPFVVFDEDDMSFGPRFLLDHFTWESASTFTVGE